MADNEDRKIIAEFYNTSHPLYQIHSLGDNEFHYGLWKIDTKTRSEASRNTSKFVVECLDLKKQDRVLDAGCGMGGTSIFMAENYGCEVVGITISDVQLANAKKNVLKSSAKKQITFLLRDYRSTGFENNSFSKIFGIESVCYATKKIDFLIEAFRLLRAGGKLAVCDVFLLKEDFTEKERKRFNRFIKGFAIPNLTTRYEFFSNLEKAGFKKIIFHDKSKEVKRSCSDIYKECLLGYPFGWLLYKLGIIPKSMLDILIAGVYQKKFAETGKLIYGVFIAEK